MQAREMESFDQRDPPAVPGGRNRRRAFPIVAAVYAGGGAGRQAARRDGNGNEGGRGPLRGSAPGVQRGGCGPTFGPVPGGSAVRTPVRREG